MSELQEQTAPENGRSGVPLDLLVSLLNCPFCGGEANKALGYELRKDQICMIGDSKNADIKGADNYGIRSCWITDEIAENAYRTFADSIKQFIV